MTQSGTPTRGRYLVLGHRDLDGIVSSALASAYLRDAGRAEDLRYRLVDFDIKDRWPRFWLEMMEGAYPDLHRPGEPLPDGVAIVDFPGTRIPPERDLFYADHHAGAFSPDEVGRDVLDDYARRREGDGDVFFDATRGSCVRLLIEELARRGWRPPPRLARAAELAHVVDTAAYGSVVDATDFSGNGAPALDLVSSMLPRQLAQRAVARLAGGVTIEAAVFDDNREFADEVVQAARNTMGIYREASRTLSGDVVLVDFTPYTSVEIPRVKFAEFMHERTRYAVQLFTRPADDGRGVVVRGVLGRSPWSGRLAAGYADPDLGHIARTVAGGGGHPYAAGFVVRSPHPEEAAQEAHRLVESMRPMLAPVHAGHPFADRSGARGRPGRSFLN